MVGIVLLVLLAIAAAFLLSRKKGDEGVSEEHRQEQTQESGETKTQSGEASEMDHEELLGNADFGEQAQQDPLSGFTAQEQTIWTTTKLNLRETPEMKGKILKVLSSGACLTSTAFNQEWYYVKLKDISGFVSAKYITKEEPKQLQQPTGAQVGGNVERPAKSTGRVVVIDPGHQAKGDSTPEPNGPGSSVMKARVTGGTRGRKTGVYEYELTLTIGNQLKAELEKRGYTVYMTRTSHNVNISNMERAQYAGNVGADIAVRLHGNGVDDSGVSGALALAPSDSNPYISHLAEASRQLSRCVLNAYCDATGMRKKGVSKSDTMTGINWSTVPVTILEMGFMTNSSDDTNMQDPVFQQRMVQGIANGIDAYFGL